MNYKPIKCAALRKGNKIYIGKCHADCFIQESKGILRDAEQGFITEDNVFVSRKLALQIANYYNQIICKHSPEDELFSEDLFEDVIIKEGE